MLGQSYATCVPLAAVPETPPGGAESLAWHRCAPRQGAITPQVGEPHRPVRRSPALRIHRRGALLDWNSDLRDPSGCAATCRMDKISFLDDLQSRVSELVRQTPAADMQKNLKALLTQQFARLELVTREEFDTQAKVLARARSKLDELEHRIAELERRP